MGNLWSEIVKHQSILHRICIYYTNTKEDYQDLFQDILFEIVKSYPRFRGESKFSTWMHRVASNTAIRFLKLSKRRPDQYELKEKVLLLENGITSLDHESKIIDLNKAISGLNKKDKLIVQGFLDGSSSAEIASTLNITPNHVRVKMFRIKKRLRNILLAG